MPRRRKKKSNIKAVDLFCGVGGLTRGLEKAGINVSLGVDIDPACEYPFTANNEAEFLLKSVEDLSGDDFGDVFDDADYTLLAGCAPCQPFSTYSQTWSTPEDHRWDLLTYFADLACEIEPDIVTMENVPRLANEDVFSDFVSTLEDEGFDVFYDIVNCADYSVPQQRQRLVLLASRLGPIRLRKPTRKTDTYGTVRRAIESLPPIGAGEISDRDPLHQAASLSPLNLKRIRASKPGGTWKDWDGKLVAKCHRKKTGKTYPSVYGRMSWDDPSPTITTQYYGFGNGRFGHPDQDRAISLREGAILQSFPRSYDFVEKGEPVHFKTIGRLIGNAVPVKLAEAIGKSIVDHVDEYSSRKKRAA